MKSFLYFFTMNKNIEIWKPVVGYEGLYEVSSYGRVRSLDRATSYISRTQEGKEYTTTHTFKGKNLSLNKRKGYYLCVSLLKDGFVKTASVHRIVAEAFLPNPNNLPMINHKDENPSNNLIWINEDGSIDYEKSNLEWCDAKYNMNYGTINRRRGESLGYGKDNPYSIPIIQYDKNGEFIKEWDSTMDVERELHIQHSNITKCCKKQLHFKTAGGFIWRYKEKAV